MISVRTRLNGIANARGRPAHGWKLSNCLRLHSTLTCRKTWKWYENWKPQKYRHSIATDEANPMKFAEPVAKFCQSTFKEQVKEQADGQTAHGTVPAGFS